jgi:hypothetical protein
MCPMCNIFNRKNRSYRKAENKKNTQVNSSISVKKLKVLPLRIILGYRLKRHGNIWGAIVMTHL